MSMDAENFSKTIEESISQDNPIVSDIAVDKKEKLTNLDDEHKAEDLNNKKDKRKLRKIYSALSFGLNCIWLSAVTTIVFFVGFKTHGFTLTQAEVITLLSTTTANILGILFIVVQYIFKD